MDSSAYKRAIAAMNHSDPHVSALGDIASDLITELEQLKEHVEALREKLHDHQQLHQD